MNRAAVVLLALCLALSLVVISQMVEIAFLRRALDRAQQECLEKVAQADVIAGTFATISATSLDLAARCAASIPVEATNRTAAHLVMESHADTDAY